MSVGRTGLNIIRNTCKKYKLHLLVTLYYKHYISKGHVIVYSRQECPVFICLRHFNSKAIVQRPRDPKKTKQTDGQRRTMTKMEKQKTSIIRVGATCTCARPPPNNIIISYLRPHKITFIPCSYACRLLISPFLHLNLCEFDSRMFKNGDGKDCSNALLLPSLPSSTLLLGFSFDLPWIQSQIHSRLCIHISTALS